MTEVQHREEVIHFCRLLHQRGYLASADGNVSVRLCQKRILVTPSGVPKAFLGPDDLLVVDREGKVLQGRGTPTGELPMHLAVLRARPDVKVVIHAHPPSTIAVSLHRRLVLDRVLPEVILDLGRMVVVPYARPGSEALARALEQQISRGDGVILERHGTLTVGRDLLEAYALTERLEHAAHVLWMANALGRPSQLSEGEARVLEDLHEQNRRRRTACVE
jgi:L-fuculose-phosphate aldolase